MKALANKIRIQFDEQRRIEIVLALTEYEIMEIQRLKDASAKGKILAVEVKKQTRRRSLDSNAFLWVMLDKLATALHASKDELYLLMLERYGVFTHVIVKAEAVDRVISEWRTVRNLGEVTIGKSKGYQLQCYFGSSTYDSAEMSRLIDGVVSECKELGIETLPPCEIEAMNKEWARKE